MTDLKHIKTFENFSQKFVENDDIEMIDEGLKDFLKDIADKIGVKFEDFITQWKDPETVAWAKKMAKGYLNNGRLDKDAYNKALSVNFDPENPKSRDFFLQMSKIKGALSIGPNSPTTKLLGKS